LPVFCERLAACCWSAAERAAFAGVAVPEGAIFLEELSPEAAASLKSSGFVVREAAFFVPEAFEPVQIGET
jgi:hypothetical protein